METSSEILNLINQGKNVGTCKNPYSFHITTGQKVKKNCNFHAQIETNYYEYYILQNLKPKFAKVYHQEFALLLA